MAKKRGLCCISKNKTFFAVQSLIVLALLISFIGMVLPLFSSLPVSSYAAISTVIAVILIVAEQFTFRYCCDHES